MDKSLLLSFLLIKRTIKTEDEGPFAEWVLTLTPKTGTTVIRYFYSYDEVITWIGDNIN